MLTKNKSATYYTGMMRRFILRPDRERLDPLPAPESADPFRIDEADIAATANMGDNFDAGSARIFAAVGLVKTQRQ